MSKRPSKISSSYKHSTDDEDVYYYTTEEEDNNDDDDDDEDSLGYYKTSVGKSIEEEFLPASEYAHIFDEEEEKDYKKRTKKCDSKADYEFEINARDCSSSSSSSSSSTAKAISVVTAKIDSMGTNDGAEDVDKSKIEVVNLVDLDDDDKQLYQNFDRGSTGSTSFNCAYTKKSTTKLYKRHSSFLQKENEERISKGTTNCFDEGEIILFNEMNVDSGSDDYQQIQQDNVRDIVDCTSTSSSTMKRTSSTFQNDSLLKVEDSTDLDAQLAAQLQAEEEYKVQINKLSRSDVHKDAEIAAQLQAEEEGHCKRRKTDEEQCMKQYKSGQAWLFIQQVLQLHQKLQPQQQEPQGRNKIDTVAIDDMVYTCEKLLECQDTFRSQNHPTHVAIGYHYTRKKAMENIKQHGLLSKKEREDMSSTLGRTGCNGAVFGNGIYTANNPNAFRHFGEVGLLVATLRGKTKRVSQHDFRSRRLNGIENNDDSHTVIGNKRDSRLGSAPAGSIRYYDEIVLRQSSQCLPLIQYDSSLANDDLIWKYHVELQKIADEFFNGEVETKLERVNRPEQDMRFMAPFGAASIGHSMLQHNQATSYRGASPTIAFGAPAFTNNSLGVAARTSTSGSIPVMNLGDFSNSAVPVLTRVNSGDWAVGGIHGSGHTTRNSVTVSSSRSAPNRGAHFSILGSPTSRGITNSSSGPTERRRDSSDSGQWQRNKQRHACLELEQKKRNE